MCQLYCLPHERMVTFEEMNLHVRTCTSQLFAWLPPNMKNVTFAPFLSIGFTFCTKRKRITTGHASKTTPKKVLVPTLPEAELFNFLVFWLKQETSSAFNERH